MDGIRNLFLFRLYLKSSFSTNKKWEIFVFQTLQVFSWNITSFFMFETRKLNFPKCKEFLRAGVFIFPARKSTFWNIRSSLKNKKVPFPEKEIFWGGFFVSRNKRKAFLWENISNFLILELESFISWNIEKYEAKKFYFRKYKKFFILGARKFHILIYKNFFYLGARKFHFLK